MLKAKNLHKSYHELHVLKGIDIEVNQGEIVSIIGASGAGKSTLLHILGLLDHPNQGQLMLNEKNVLAMRGNELAYFRNQHIGFIFQFHNLLPEFTALENVCIPGYLGNEKSKNVENKAKDLLGFLGLNDRINHKPSEMSGGELQRTAVARALINDPSIVFADEPSGNLDSKNAEELHRLFFTLREKLAQTFVIVTHNRKLAAMADRQLEIKDGRIV